MAREWSPAQRYSHSRRADWMIWFNRLYLGLLTLIGLYCLVLGGALVYFGGSVYYLLSGAALLYTVFQLIKRRPSALKTFGVLMGVTVLWSLYESGPVFLSLLPRLAMWMVLGLWFLSPLLDRQLGETSTSQHRLWIGIPISSAALALVAVLLLPGNVSEAQPSSLPPTADVDDWKHYGNTSGGTRFASQDQIRTDNVDGLTELWRYRTGVEGDFKMTPLQVGEYLYLCTTHNTLIALDSATGDELWRHDPQVEPPADHQYARTCRGISYAERESPTGESCDARIITGTVDARLIAVDALAGERCKRFGDNGAVDVTPGLGEHLPDQYYLTSPPLVAGTHLVVGGLVLDSQNLGLPSGVVRAYDLETGEFRWVWDLGRPGVYDEPAPGERYTPPTENGSLMPASGRHYCWDRTTPLYIRVPTIRSRSWESPIQITPSIIGGSDTTA